MRQPAVAGQLLIFSPLPTRLRRLRQVRAQKEERQREVTALRRVVLREGVLASTKAVHARKCADTARIRDDLTRRRGAADVQRMAHVEPASAETVASVSLLVNDRICQLRGPGAASDHNAIFYLAVTSVRDESLGMDAGCACTPPARLLRTASPPSPGRQTWRGDNPQPPQPRTLRHLGQRRSLAVALIRPGPPCGAAIYLCRSDSNPRGGAWSVMRMMHSEAGYANRLFYGQFEYLLRKLLGLSQADLPQAHLEAVWREADPGLTGSITRGQLGGFLRRGETASARRLRLAAKREAVLAGRIQACAEFAAEELEHRRQLWRGEAAHQLAHLEQETAKLQQAEADIARRRAGLPEAQASCVQATRASSAAYSPLTVSPARRRPSSDHSPGPHPPRASASIAQPLPPVTLHQSAQGVSPYAATLPWEAAPGITSQVEPSRMGADLVPLAHSPSRRDWFGSAEPPPSVQARGTSSFEAQAPPPSSPQSPARPRELPTLGARQQRPRPAIFQAAFEAAFG